MGDAEGFDKSWLQGYEHCADLEENAFVEDENIANALEEGQEAEAFIGSYATFLKLNFVWRPKTYCSRSNMFWSLRWTSNTGALIICIDYGNITLLIFTKTQKLRILLRKETSTLSLTTLWMKKGENWLGILMHQEIWNPRGHLDRHKFHYSLSLFILLRFVRRTTYRWHCIIFLTLQKQWFLALHLPWCITILPPGEHTCHFFLLGWKPCDALFYLFKFSVYIGQGCADWYESLL